MLSPIKANLSNNHWVNQEFLGVGLGNKRLDLRAKRILKDMLKKPSASMPLSCGNHAATKACYRFLHNVDVKFDDIASCHRRKTAERAQRARVSGGVLLAVQDTTQLDFTTHEATTGLGVLHFENRRGLMLHTVMAVLETGETLGLLDQQFWVRHKEEFGKSKRRAQRRVDEKESNKWIKGFENTESLAELLPAHTVVHVGDREADIFDLLRLERPAQHHILVRARHNRLLASEELKLWEHMKAIEPAGTMQVNVPGGHGQKPRKAVLTVRYDKITLKVPRNRGEENLEPITLWAVFAEEESVLKTRISWMLLSTLAVENLEAAKQRIHWYSQRWKIEMFHRILKSGCDVESCRLGDVESLKRYIVLQSIVAWRVLYCTTTGREHPEWPCSVILEEDEWKVLYCLTKKTKKPPQEPPSLGDATMWIAKLGGFLGRKRDGHPGSETLQRGLERLVDFAAAYAVFK